MAQILITDELLEQVEKARESLSIEDFVADAVLEKIASLKRKSEFYRLSDETRRLMHAKGLTEAEILAEFEAFRESLIRD